MRKNIRTALCIILAFAPVTIILINLNLGWTFLSYENGSFIWQAADAQTKAFGKGVISGMILSASILAVILGEMNLNKRRKR